MAQTDFNPVPAETDRAAVSTSVDIHPPIPTSFWVFGAIIAGLLALAWLEPFKWMYDRWMMPDSYYSHGILVPLVALYFAWIDRENLRAASGPPSMLGLGVFLFGLLLLMASGIQVVYFPGAFAIIPTVWGLCGYLFGIGVMKRLVLPMFILLFMIPPPLQTIDDVSNRMKLFVADVALAVFNLLGIVSVKDGATIYLGNATVTVGNACSGLRSLISLLFMGVLFAAASGLPFWRRIALFAASIPIAILSNVARVLFLCWIAYEWGNKSVDAKWGVGPLRTSWHDASGYMIFIVAFALLYAVLRLLSLGAPKPQSSPVQPLPGQPGVPPAPSDSPRRAKTLRLASTVALLTIAASASATILYQRGMEDAPLRTPGIPLDVAGWVGSDMPLGKDVTDILETNDVIQRNYRSPALRSRLVQLAVVFSPSNRRVAHPPEVCYMNVGWEVADKRIQKYDGIPDMVRMILHHSRRRDIVLYCFLAGNDFTANYYRQQYNIARNTLTGQPTSSALIRMSTTVGEEESEQQGEDRLLTFARAIMPQVETHLK